MTIPNDTTAKLIGLAATGAAMLGLSLEDALLTDPAALSHYIRTLTGKPAPATATPAEEDPAVLTALNLPAAPVAAAANYPGAQPARLGRPGEPIQLTEEQAAAMDWEALCR